MRGFLQQFSGELLKLFARKRTYIGFAAFLGVEVIILFLLNLPRVRGALARVIEDSGYPAGDYLSGLTLGFFVLLWSVFLLGALYLALVAGDVVGKEVEDGTLRMMLCRPVSRGRILTLKACAVIVYSFALTWFVGLTALIVGLLHSGAGGLFVFAPMEKVFALYDFGPGLARYALAVFFLSLSLLTIPAVGFFLSCLDMKPAAATIGTLSLFFLDSILKNIPFFESLKPWFITSHMAAWVHVFEYRIPWEHMIEDYAWLLAINATLIVLARAIFQRRDFKS
jgi:ABC-2 type transport system permease protein